MTRDPHPLTEEQRAALAPEVQLIEAGPGTGKTKTIVARYRQQAQTRAGIALLSFTNAAVNVARSRCVDDPALVEPPNFIGTFDQFLHRYVVTPAVRRSARQAPTYVHSWDDLAAHLSSVRLRAGTAIRLSLFSDDAAGAWSVNASQFNRSEKYLWDKMATDDQSRMIAIAASRINSLRRSHVYNAHEARRLALDLIQKNTDHVRTMLARRFHEVIVDEFQDCDDVEYSVLALFRGEGINVVTVADPDQAIYEFRQNNSGSDLYKKFRTSLDKTQIVSLTTSFRSTPAICALVSSLRAVGTDALNSASGDIVAPSGIHVVVGTGVGAGAAALHLVRQNGVASAQTRVVAHRRSDARSLTQAGNQPPHKASNMEKLLAPLAEFRAGADARVRLAALRRIEQFVLDMFDWTHLEATMREQQLDHLGITTTQLRIVASKILAASSNWASAAACKLSVVKILKALDSVVPVPLKAKVATRLPISVELWKFWESRAAPSSTDLSDAPLRWSHVHAIKGEEYDAIVMALPTRAIKGKNVLSDWEGGLNTEDRRVLYVGVSRARRVLVLVTPSAKKVQLERILTSSGIQFSVEVAR